MLVSPAPFDEVKLIEFPRIQDQRGNLSYFENNHQIPFSITRTYCIYDLPGGAELPGYAYHYSQEVIVALAGSFDVIVSNGKEKKSFTLNRSYYGLYIPARIWRHLENFATNSLACIVTNGNGDDKDLIKNFENLLLENE